MSTARQRRRGTTAQHATFTGLNAELTVDTDKHTVVVHDGTTAGGYPLAKVSDFSAIETQIHAATGKTTPVDADETALVDSAASNGLKKLTWADLKATLWVALGPAIAALTGKTTPVDADTFVISDSAASSATKKLTWANVKAALNTYFQALGSLTLAAGDILYASGVGTLARLAKGTDGQVLTLASGVPSWAAAAASSGTARNRIVNPSMQISSINGNTSGTSSGYSPADNWATFCTTSAGTITTQRVQSATPAGSKDRARITITAADSSLAAGEFLTFTQNLIGQEVADLLYGTASAKNIVLRFGFKGPAGTYAVHLGNSAANRSYVALFTISAGNANADTTQTVSIVGDTTGTWLTDTGTGITLDIVLACGSTYQGVTGWQAGNLLGTSGVSNGMATLASVFEIYDVGLYGDPSATGTAPTFETPSYKAQQNGVVGPLFSSTQATTSGTSKDYLAPNGMVPRRVTVNISGLSTSGTSDIIIQIGDSGGVETSGYLGAGGVVFAGTPSVTNYTTGFGFVNGNASNVFHGSVVISLGNPSTPKWVAAGVLGASSSAVMGLVAGSKSLSPGPIDRVRLTTVGGTDTVDAGETTVTWE